MVFHVKQRVRTCVVVWTPGLGRSRQKTFLLHVQRIKRVKRLSIASQGLAVLRQDLPAGKASHGIGSREHRGLPCAHPLGRLGSVGHVGLGHGLEKVDFLGVGVEDVTRDAVALALARTLAIATVAAETGPRVIVPVIPPGSGGAAPGSHKAAAGMRGVVQRARVGHAKTPGADQEVPVGLTLPRVGGLLPRLRPGPLGSTLNNLSVHV